jgi:hypothetical protein
MRLVQCLMKRSRGNARRNNEWTMNCGLSAGNLADMRRFLAFADHAGGNADETTEHSRL